MIQNTIENLPSDIVLDIERIEIPGENGVKIHGVIIYPQGYNPTKAHCIVYSNPNGVTVPEFLKGSGYS
jgi:hypothetical protein